MYEIVEKLMESRGLKPSDVAKATGIPSSVFTDWKKGRYTPKADKLYILARFFEVPMEIFFEEDTKRLAHFYEALNGEYASVEMKGFSPVFDVACGEGRINGDYATEYMDDDAEDGYSWCEVHGDSMLPILQDGDYVKVKHTTETTPQDLTVIKIDGEASTVKHVQIVENGVMVRAENEEVFPERFFSISEVMTLPLTVIGKVVELRRKF